LFYFGAQRVAMRDTNGVTYLHSDHLGSTSATSGANTGTQVYFPFGGIRAGSVATDFGFTGQKLDASDGLMYYGARYYDAALGRFISADTIVPSAGNPQSLNRYAYGLNNPVKYTDPSGHCPEAKGKGAAICFDLFIKPERVPVAGGLWVLLGDDRDFSLTSSRDASRAYVLINLETGEVEKKVNQTSYCCGYAPVGPSEQNSLVVVLGQDGVVHITYDVVLGGFLENVAPHINGTISFYPLEGEDGYGAIGAIDGFPWAEATYRDKNGNVSFIFKREAIDGNPENLNNIEPIRRRSDEPFLHWLRDNYLVDPKDRGVKTFIFTPGTFRSSGERE